MIDTPQSTRFHPIRNAYQQVGDQLRELIISGDLRSGERLPTETQLAQQFGVSRPTVREALRVLSAQNLIYTVKGVRGGTFITLPSVDNLSDYLGTSISLLSDSASVSLEQFLEARELLEVPATRLAARRATEASVEKLHSQIPDSLEALSKHDQFVFNKGFHTAIVESCGNPLLYLAAQPIFSVLQTRLKRSTLPQGFYTTIHEHHEKIAVAVGAGDEETAAEHMKVHLEYLRPSYERAWRGG